MRALANAQSLMLADGGTDLAFLLEQMLQPYGAGERIKIAGPSVRLSPGAASGFSMATHELATNAAKYGALSTAAGSVSVKWHSVMREDSVAMMLRLSNDVRARAVQLLADRGLEVSRMRRLGQSGRHSCRRMQRSSTSRLLASCRFERGPQRSRDHMPRPAHQGASSVAQCRARD